MYLVLLKSLIPSPHCVISQLSFNLLDIFALVLVILVIEIYLLSIGFIHPSLKPLLPLHCVPLIIFLMIERFLLKNYTVLIC